MSFFFKSTVRIKLPFQTLGNHDFDNEIDGVVPFLDTLQSPVVVCNIDDSEEPRIQGKYTNSIVIDRYGRKIGIIGVILSTTNVHTYRMGII